MQNLIQELVELSKSGHSCMPLPDISDGSSTFSQADNLLLKSKELTGFEEDGRRFVSLQPLFDAEHRIVKHLKRISDSWAPPAIKDKIVGELSHDQFQAMNISLGNAVSIITGPPGSGKTLLVTKLIRTFENSGLLAKAVAFTGKASRRIKEMCACDSSTIHMAISKAKKTRKIKSDVLIIDEASMVDSMLMADLLEVVRPGTTLIIVGDVEQLPSIGAGDVMKDLIESHCFPVSLLTTNHRQGTESVLAQRARQVADGVMPLFSDEFECLETEDIIKSTLDMWASMCQVYQGVQILTCEKSSLQGGTMVLNERIRSWCRQQRTGNADDEVSGHVSLGDKVMQTKNDYRRGLCNGDMGVVIKEKPLTVDFGSKHVMFDEAGAAAVELAYAVTMHKFQGSETECIIIPIWVPCTMMNRQLVYSALTRAKHKVVFIGSQEALQSAIDKGRPERHTCLKHCLSQRF